ncbi:hypothetical protein SUDANB95_08035 (plasmid) [Actinosynnema sp. ALI-1.44]
MTRHADRKKAVRALMAQHPDLTYRQAARRLTEATPGALRAEHRDGVPVAVVGVVEFVDHGWLQVWELYCTRCPCSMSMGPREDAVAAAIAHDALHKARPGDWGWEQVAPRAWRRRPEQDEQPTAHAAPTLIR